MYLQYLKFITKYFVHTMNTKLLFLQLFSAVCDKLSEEGQIIELYGMTNALNLLLF